MSYFHAKTLAVEVTRRGLICWLSGIAIFLAAVSIETAIRYEQLDWSALAIFAFVPAYTLIGAFVTSPVAIMMMLVVRYAAEFFVRSPLLAGSYMAVIGGAVGFAVLSILGFGQTWLASARMAAGPSLVAGVLFGLWGRIRPLDLLDARP